MSIIGQRKECNGMDLELFGTLGPACHDVKRLKRMIESGMNGIRLNLSHGSLEEKQDWIAALHEAQKETGQRVTLLVDLRERELRIQDMEPLDLETGSCVGFGRDIPADRALCSLITPGMTIQLDDGRVKLRALNLNADGSRDCEVLQGGCLQGRKSCALEGAPIPFSPLCEDDLKNLDNARRFGVTALMVPFVQSARDLETVRRELTHRGLNLRLYAKIENEEGCRNLEKILPLADMIVIARGDLGQDTGLVRLPGIQRDLERRCQRGGKPWMVVTELLASMVQSPVCTRAEANDVFRAVADGASAVMLTNETAAGQWPEEAMDMLCRLAREGLREREALASAVCDGRPLDH